MALCSDAAMMLFYDIEGDTRDHDEWHSYEHFHERLSVPGFIRATRWKALNAKPRYMVMYEVRDLGIATSPEYLHRLNNPTPWTIRMMPRFSGMIRGFSSISAGYGYGFGGNATVIRFVPKEGSDREISDSLVRELMPALASQRGIVGCHLLEPAVPPPMTREQSLRGPDIALPWLVLLFAYDVNALNNVKAERLTEDTFGSWNVEGAVAVGDYVLDHSATNLEVSRSKPR